MGIIIETASTDGWPRQIKMSLTCDKTTSLLCRGSEVFADCDGFIAAHKRAILSGWLERQSNRGRIWLCPACSGKQSTSGG